MQRTFILQIFIELLLNGTDTMLSARDTKTNKTESTFYRSLQMPGGERHEDQ